MNNLKKNIDHYMKANNFKTYIDLLLKIADELGITGEEKYNFAMKEKHNFSKMLNRKRPLKYEFIIPLEKIFGVPLARLLNEDAYKLPVEKENVPFHKGFRYYAYLDDPELYKKELRFLYTTDGKPIISRTDEYDKTFIDYIVEYGSVNGVRFLYEEYGIRLRGYHCDFEFSKDKKTIWHTSNKLVEFAQLVANMNDTELFNNIYDTYYTFFSWGHDIFRHTTYNNSDFLEVILDNDHLFDSIFEEKTHIKEYWPKPRTEANRKLIPYHSINPIINNLLRHALNNLDKYKHRAIVILEFGIEHNRKIKERIHSKEIYDFYFRLGALENSNDIDYIKVIIFTDVETNDDEINNLIDKLPKFETY